MLALDGGGGGGGDLRCRWRSDRARPTPNTTPAAFSCYAQLSPARRRLAYRRCADAFCCCCCARLATPSPEGGKKRCARPLDLRCAARNRLFNGVLRTDGCSAIYTMYETQQNTVGGQARQGLCAVDLGGLTRAMKSLLAERLHLRMTDEFQVDHKRDCNLQQHLHHRTGYLPPRSSSDGHICAPEPLQLT